MPAEFRCLSIRQPWAWAICAGVRGVDNRTWSTDYRGQIAIHASSKPLEKGQFDGNLDISLLTYGAIIGTADLVDVVELTESLDSDPWASGPLCWLLQNGRLFAEPIRFKGKLQLYTLADDVAALVREQLALPARESPVENTRVAVEAIRPLPLDLCLWRAGAYAQLHAIDGVHRMASEAIRLDPQCGCAFRLRAAKSLNNGEWQASILDLDEAIRLDGGDAFAWYSRSIAWEELGDTARADADRQRAVEILPNVAELVEPDNEG
jgi:tetratricopeptide (TPR) repeat protein